VVTITITILDPRYWLRVRAVVSTQAELPSTRTLTIDAAGTVVLWGWISTVGAVTAPVRTGEWQEREPDLSMQCRA
jgi:hypothetical protein